MKVVSERRSVTAAVSEDVCIVFGLQMMDRKKKTRCVFTEAVREVMAEDEVTR